VDETTPQFRNFKISNIYCNGAEKAIFFRGLPEMPVLDIEISNAVLHAKKAIDIQEAFNISLKNITVFSEETEPVVEIINSKNIQLDHLDFSADAKLLFRVSGERAENIKVTNTHSEKAKEAIRVELGAADSAIQIIKK
jgi:hypothetical protein